MEILQNHESAGGAGRYDVSKDKFWQLIFLRFHTFFIFFILALPEVKVMPRIQSRRPGERTSMFCHVIGEPFPEVNDTVPRSGYIFFQSRLPWSLVDLTIVVCVYLGGLAEK